MQFPRRHIWRDRDLFSHGNRACIKPHIHLHDHHAGLGVARHDRALNRRRSAPARQKRGMAIVATKTRCIENGLRQQQAISHNNRNIGFEAFENILLFRTLKAFGRENRNAEFLSLFMNWRLGQLESATTCRARRLCIDRHHFIAMPDNSSQNRHREIRRPHKYDTHHNALFDARWLASFLNFLMTISRFSLEI